MHRLLTLFCLIACSLHALSAPGAAVTKAFVDDKGDLCTSSRRMAANT